MAILTDLHIGVRHFTSGILSIKENVDAIYKYTSVLTRHVVVVAQDDLCHMLVQVKHDV